MEKKMYKQPKSEVLTIHSEYMMLDPVSPGAPTDPTSPPEVHMPGRKGDYIY